MTRLRRFALQTFALPSKQIMSPPEEIASNVLTDCVALIDPAKEKKDDCIDEIRSAYRAVHWTAANRLSFPKDRVKARKNLKKLISRLESLIELSKICSTLWAHISLEILEQGRKGVRSDGAYYHFVGELGLVLEAAKRNLAVLQRGEASESSRRCDFGKRREDKTVAAEAAIMLLRHGTRKPTLTARGPYVELTAAIYDAAAGESGASVERQCREVFHRWRRAIADVSPHDKRLESSSTPIERYEQIASTRKRGESDVEAKKTRDAGSARQARPSRRGVGTTRPRRHN